ncbi:hypothetical protein HELRODRAFT_175166 [Helobdella robusta]|uniref:Uncharacterized protein n=1 Tax=Helobdella robusta TaxID=6412 RepID=T1F8Y2_HELRO|nr:hypothetical protein HELRODRAFT_175166 [Helobdella robusta]ESO01137.1 hypothetical protein HELRODRAFT_175166 [Helobdella robusta]
MNCGTTCESDTDDCSDFRGRKSSKKGGACDFTSCNKGKGDQKGEPKCSCRGGESFQKWKKEMLSKECSKGSCGKNAKRSYSDTSCRATKKSSTSSKECCGCSCASFVFCAAALVAVGVTAAYIKKKYID